MNRINAGDEVAWGDYIPKTPFARVISFLKNVTMALSIIWIKITLSGMCLLRTNKAGASFTIAN